MSQTTVGQSTEFESGRRLRIKESAELHELSGAIVHVIKSYIGSYPSIEGAVYYKVKLEKTRERCRYCGAPREYADEPCRPIIGRGGGLVIRDDEARAPHEWLDASVIDVHTAWLEEIR